MIPKKPVIALTPYFQTEREEPYMRPAYLKALKAAGAISVILPLDLDQAELLTLLDRTDGILFTGGPDIHPFFFGEETHANCGNVCLRRDRMELLLLELAMKQQKPILGICRGAQLLNLGLGGAIYQDIPSQFHSDFPIAHAQPFQYNLPSHHVELVPGTKLAAISGTLRLEVNSFHHQAISRPAPDLTVCAVSPDGLTEAVEKSDYPFFLGIQWHPEYLWEQDPAAAALFRAFVDAAKRN